MSPSISLSPFLHLPSKPWLLSYHSPTPTTPVSTLTLNLSIWSNADISFQSIIFSITAYPAPRFTLPPPLNAALRLSAGSQSPLTKTCSVTRSFVRDMGGVGLGMNGGLRREPTRNMQRMVVLLQLVEIMGFHFRQPSRKHRPLTQPLS